MAGNLLPLLLVGGAAVVVMSKKKKKKGGRKVYALVGEQCIFLSKAEGQGIENWSEEKIMRFLRQLLMMVQKLYSDFGIDSLESPGDPKNNRLWAQAVATRGFRGMISPECLKSIGAPADFGADTNPHGPDLINWENWPGDSRTYFESILFGIHKDMVDRGLDITGARPREGEGKTFSFVPNTRGDYLAKAMMAAMKR